MWHRWFTEILIVSFPTPLSAAKLECATVDVVANSGQTEHGARIDPNG